MTTMYKFCGFSMNLRGTILRSVVDGSVGTSHAGGRGSKVGCSPIMHEKLEVQLL